MPQNDLRLFLYRFTEELINIHKLELNYYIY